jgi:hypothetical protein
MNLYSILTGQDFDTVTTNAKIKTNIGFFLCKGNRGAVKKLFEKGK